MNTGSRADPVANRGVPSRGQAIGIATELLAEVGSRLAHVLRAGNVAASLAGLFSEAEAELLVAAATLHDIGYAPRIAATGYHSLDGGLYLRRIGLSERLAGLVAHHSLAYLNAPDHGIVLTDWFPRETGLLADALIFADMHAAPDGRHIHHEDRFADIAGRHAYPNTGHRLELLREAVRRISQAAQEAGVPVLDLRSEAVLGRGGIPA